MDQSSNDGNKCLTIEELIRMEINGKNQALARYDSVLWKIRSGYAVVLYGALSLIIKTTGGENFTLKFPSFLTFGLLIIGFSLFAFFIDYNFLKGKLRVVQASDKLFELSHRMATGKDLLESQKKELLKWLQNAGESNRPVAWDAYPNNRDPLYYLYFGTAAIGIVIITLLFFSDNLLLIRRFFKNILDLVGQGIEM